MTISQNEMVVMVVQLCNLNKTAATYTLNKGSLCYRNYTPPTKLLQMQQGPWGEQARPQEHSGPFTNFPLATTNLPRDSSVSARQDSSPFRNTSELLGVQLSLSR